MRLCLTARALGLFLVLAAPLAADEQRVTLSFRGASLPEVAAIYEELSGVSVQLHPTVRTMQLDCTSRGPVPASDAVTLISRALRLHGVHLFTDGVSSVWSPEDQAEKANSVMEVKAWAAKSEAGQSVKLRYVTPGDALQAVVAYMETQSPASGMTAPQTLVPAPVATVGPDTAKASFTARSVNGIAVVGDMQSGSLHLRGDSATVRRCVELLRSIDLPPVQVELEVTIAEISSGRDLQSGVDWLAAWTTAKGLAYTMGNGTLPGAAATSAGFMLRVDSPEGWSAVIQALEGTDRFRVVQRPRLVALNHHVATIFSGKDIPVAGETLTEGGNGGGQVNVASTTQFVPVRMEVKITPHVQADGQIRLEFEEKNNDVVGTSRVGGNDVPQIGTQGLSNTVIVPDGACVVLGGIRSDIDRDGSATIPGLGRIPVIRWLAGKQTRKTERRDLVIMVRPRVISLPVPIEAKDISNLFDK